MAPLRDLKSLHKDSFLSAAMIYSSVTAYNRALLGPVCSQPQVNVDRLSSTVNLMGEKYLSLTEYSPVPYHDLYLLYFSSVSNVFMTSTCISVLVNTTVFYKLLILLDMNTTYTRSFIDEIIISISVFLRYV